MSSQVFREKDASSPDEIEVSKLYRDLLDSWNRRNADDFAALFADDSEVIGFDGSQQLGQAEIASTLQTIFTDHVTAPYVSKIKTVRFLSPDIAIVRAIVGMVPPGKSELEPKLNAHQTLIAARREDKWLIALFQNTPAQFHGRPELVQQMTEELRQLL